MLCYKKYMGINKLIDIYNGMCVRIENTQLKFKKFSLPGMRISNNLYKKSATKTGQR